MDVGPCRISRRTGISNDISLLYGLTGYDIEAFIMAVQGRHAIAVINDDGIAIAADPVGFDDDATHGCLDWRADIHTGMKDLPAINGMDAVSEGRCNDALHRPDHITPARPGKGFAPFKIFFDRFTERLGNAVFGIVPVAPLLYLA